MTGNQTWAARGYAVFWPEARAPHTWINPFKSRTFDHAGKGPSGLSVMADDVRSGVQSLIQRGLVDPERMGLYGFSNGGAVVNQLVTRTNIFKCAISVAAATSVDWSGAFFLHSMNPMVPKMVGALPWEDPEAYIELSVIYHIDRIQTPMMLADGDDDGDFLLSSIKMYNGLRFLGKDVVFLRYPGQGHELGKAATADFWQRANIFFDSHLKSDRSH
jgi:dipeptidyl aminopeptidase/acylaminoacyl peptidase